MGDSECLCIKIFTCDQYIAPLSFIAKCLRYFSNIISHLRGGINASTGNSQHSEVRPNCSGFLEVTQIAELFSGFPELGIHRQS